MPESGEYRELTAEDASLNLSPENFGFQTTDELQPLDEVVGQPRAMRALDLGLGIRHPNYHIYAAGMSGTGKMEMIRQTLAARTPDASVPDDWFYLNNFDEPDRPLAMTLPAGQGIQFKRELEALIDTLLDALPKAFRQEEFGREKGRLREQYRQQGEAILNELDKIAREYKMTVQQLPDGQILFIPLKDGEPMKPEEVQQLSPEELEELEENQQKLIEKAGNVLSRQQEMERQLTTEVRDVAHAFARRLVEPITTAIANQHESHRIQEWLEKLTEHILEHLDRFRESTGAPHGLAALLGEGQPDRGDRFLEYRVNLVIDNSQLQQAPVVIEDAPNYRNLFGTIERVVDRSGRVITNFTRIKAGSLLKASGGYLILNLMDALVEPFVWKELKRTLKNGLLEIEAYDPFSMFTVSALKPEAIPLRTKLVVLGEPLIYHLLYLYDEDFREIFRVKADFDDEMDRDEQAGQIYGRFVRKLGETEDLLPFDAHGVAELVRTGARLTGNKHKLSTAFSRVADVTREADYWARQDGAEVVTSRHVEQAGREKVYRSDLIAAKIRELIDDGTLLIDLRESTIGQINGLAVADLGDYLFGRPMRLTASVGVGAAGIVNIERESRLSGRIFDKGLLILEGFLRNKYASQRALSLSASIAMEQSYGGIDGDSASVGELLCLLSALAEVPLRQDIAVTGSINQWGQVQAIGAVNEKIEGFFDICQQQGLSGNQGVCFPSANVKNLILRSDVVQAIAEDRFHIWSVNHIDQAIELFAGMPAGNAETESSFHYRVCQRLNGLADALKGQRTGEAMQYVSTHDTPPDRPPDPRPPLPGRR